MKLPRITFNRHFYITLVCAVIVFALGVVSNQAWHTQVVKNQVSAAKQHAIAVDKQRRQAATVAAEKAKVKAECDKEVAYYNSLTALQKKGKDAPACVALTANF